MDTKSNINAIIMKVASEKTTFRTADILEALETKVTTQYLSSLIGKLVKQGSLVKSGSTAKATYALPDNANELGTIIRKHLINGRVKEHEVLDDINHQAHFLVKLNENLRSLFDYALSEMLNNAIDHSQSKYINIEVGVDNKNLKFIVSDAGIGVFRNVMHDRKLQSEFEAMQDLLKGKTTTQPHAHSGEGIFFTSKVADVFILESFGYLLRVDNSLNDVFFQEVNSEKKGTKVSFILSKHTQKHLKDIFSQYETDHNDPNFDKTKIQVKLYTIGTIYVSRSQARRILTGLEKFKTIILNFDHVPTIGQAFADEIFRVFKQKYPTIEIIPTNMNEAVKYMVDRAGK
jgi:anti-sigma regulatory factor (Ser/Thr protein kinase)